MPYEYLPKYYDALQFPAYVQHENDEADGPDKPCLRAHFISLKPNNQRNKPETY
jgi:hypothetical protein